MHVYASEFAKSTGYPLATIKRLCREGIISYLPVGRKYLINTEIALKSLADYKEHSPQKSTVNEVISNNRSVSRKQTVFKNDKRDFINALQQLCKKNV